MTLTINELKERIAKYYDVITLCELLSVTEDDILERFEDRFLANIEELHEEMYDGVYDQQEDQY